MKNPFQFIQEARNETRKVVWPTRNETLISTAMVLVVVALLTGFFAIVDWVLALGLRTILNFFA